MISAVISDGKSRELLKRGIANQYLIVTSDLILKESTKVLRRPKFDLSEDELQRTIHALIKTAEVVNVKTKIKAVKDDMIIETAIDGCADTIVTGDNHLLTLNCFRGIKITTVEKMIVSLQTLP